VAPTRIELLQRMPVFGAIGEAALDFIVGNGGLKFRIPVDDARSAINDAVFKHAAERFIDCFVPSFVERVRFARPIE
jgi:hypothetical protein